MFFSSLFIYTKCLHFEVSVQGSPTLENYICSGVFDWEIARKGERERVKKDWDSQVCHAVTQESEKKLLNVVVPNLNVNVQLLWFFIFTNKPCISWISKKDNYVIWYLGIQLHCFGFINAFCCGKVYKYNLYTCNVKA